MTGEVAGIFNLVNPPTPEDAAVIEKTVAHCDFPWEVLKSYMDDHFIKAIDVKWKKNRLKVRIALRALRSIKPTRSK